MMVAQFCRYTNSHFIVHFPHPEDSPASAQSLACRAGPHEAGRTQSQGRHQQEGSGQTWPPEEMAPAQAVETHGGAVFATQCRREHETPAALLPSRLLCNFRL